MLIVIVMKCVSNQYPAYNEPRLHNGTKEIWEMDHHTQYVIHPCSIQIPV